jgi:hypothetical protein
MRGCRRSTDEAAHWVLTAEAPNVPSKPAASWGPSAYCCLVKARKGNKKGCAVAETASSTPWVPNVAHGAQSYASFCIITTQYDAMPVLER